jgi:outer membrane protein TolC
VIRFASVCLTLLLALGPTPLTVANEPVSSAPKPSDASQPSAIPVAPKPTKTGADKDAAESEVLLIDLPTALRLVQTASPTISLARERVTEAYARLDQADVLWLPDLRLGPAYQRHDGQTQNTDGTIIGVSKSSFFVGGGAALSLEISDALFAPLVARRLAQAEAAAAESVSQQVQLDVVLAYFDLLRGNGQLAINADTLERTRAMVRFAELVDKAGLSKSTADVNRVRAEVASLERERINLEGDAAVTSARLAQLLLLRPTVDLRPADPAVVPLTLVPTRGSLDDLIAEGLLNRPELAESRELVAAALARWRQARVGPLVPRLDAVYFGGDFGGGQNSHMGNFGGRGDGLVQVTWELHNFLAGDLARARERRAQVNVANLHVVEVEAQVAAEVTGAAKVARKRLQTLQSAQTAVIEALETWRRLEEASRQLLQGGKLVDTLEPFIAVQALNQARSQYLLEVIEYNRTQFRLYTAMGQPSADALPKAAAEPLKVPALPIPDKDMPRPKP